MKNIKNLLYSFIFPFLGLYTSLKGLYSPFKGYLCGRGVVPPPAAPVQGHQCVAKRGLWGFVPVGLLTELDFVKEINKKLLINSLYLDSGGFLVYSSTQ